MNLLPVSFEQAKARLLSLQTPDIDDAVRALRRLNTFLTICTVAAENEPEILAARTKDMYCHELLREPATVEEKGIGLLNNLFPVHEDAMAEYLQEDPSQLYIPYLCCNLAGSWDEFDEAVNDIEHLSQDWAVIAFAHFLNYNVDGEEFWQNASAHFGWPISEPPRAVTGHIECLDGDQFYAALEAEELHDFEAAFRMAFHDTDTIFLDSSYDDPDWGQVDFSLVNIRLLVNEWQSAKRIIEAAERANQAACENPDLYVRVLELYEAAITFKR
jgi:hypothetical protein